MSDDGNKRLADALPSKTTLNARKSRKVWSCCCIVSESESALCLVPFVQCSFSWHFWMFSAGQQLDLTAMSNRKVITPLPPFCRFQFPFELVPIVGMQSGGRAGFEMLRRLLVRRLRVSLSQWLNGCCSHGWHPRSKGLFNSLILCHRNRMMTCSTFCVQEFFKDLQSQSRSGPETAQ